MWELEYANEVKFYFLDNYLYTFDWTFDNDESTQ